MRSIRWETKTRYYAAVVYQDLLGDWIVAVAWGGLGNKLGNSAQQVAGSYGDAVQALASIHRQRKKRHYGIVASH